MLNIIVAPASENKKAEKQTKNIVKFLKQEKQDYSVFFSLSSEDFKSNVKHLISSGETDFVVVGDDKTINLFVNSVKDLSKIKLGIIPAGNSDDFAVSLGISTSTLQAIKDILENKIEAIDYLIANDEKVVNNIAIGAPVETAEDKESGLKGFFARRLNYSKADKFEGVEITVDVKGGKTKKEHIYELVIANGGLSKGKQVSPLSNMKDGLFNLLYTQFNYENNKNKLTRMFGKGKHIYSDYTKQLWLNNVRLTNSNKSIKCLIDGTIKTVDELNVSIVEKGLKIFKK